MPTLTIVAGANGAGKTTLTSAGREAFQSFASLDPDAISKTMKAMGMPNASGIDAGRSILLMVEERLQKRDSFLIETTLSGQSYLRLMRRAAGLDYRVRLIYVGTSGVEINIRRVRQRVRMGDTTSPRRISADVIRAVSRI